MNLQLEVITPEKVIYSDEANEIIAQTEKGQIGILPHHVGLFTKLIPGELIIKKGNKEDSLAVAGGFLDVHDNKVVILADYAIRSEEIEIAKAEEAKKRTEQLMKEKSSEANNALLEAQLRRALLELNVGNKLKVTKARRTS